MDSLTLTPSLPLRSRVALALRFDFAPQATAGLTELQCHLNVNETTVEAYESGIYTLPALWNAATQCPEGDSAEARIVSQLLSDIRAGHLSILQALIRADLPVNAERVRHHWLSGESIAPQLIHVYDEYLTTLLAMPKPERRAVGTLYKWQLSYRYLRTYLESTGQTDLALNRVTTGWAKDYYQWLRARPLAINYSTELIGNVREILRFALENELIPENKLSSLKLTWQAAKAIHCLSLVQLRTLAQVDLPKPLDRARCWALLCCYTGLDYPDAIVIAKSPEAYLVRLPQGDKIVWKRLKVKQVHQAYPEWAICHIPLLEETRQLLPRMQTLGAPSFTGLNENLKKIEGRLALPFRFTTKVCRKTAGALFIHRGYRMEAVQKILGLKDFRTFQRHYLSTWNEVVDDNMERLQGWESGLEESAVR
jgi:site-specific recombinase XerD